MSTFIRRLATPEGDATPKARGPGAPVRVAVKDLIHMAGIPTTNGSQVVARGARPEQRDAACLAASRREEERGDLIFVGKTNLHELAFGVTGINPWFGTPVNPIDPDLVPGGSSSGAAVAVAAGDADISFGSDTGGSIRIPATCCGVVGLKTTRGRVSLEGVLPLAPSLDTVGPLARTVADTARGMGLLDPRFSLPADGVATRIGRVRLSAEGWIDAAIDEAVHRYASEVGGTVTDVDLPGWTKATTAVMTILSAEAWNVHSDLWQKHNAELSPDVAQRLELASLLEAEEVAAAWEVARDWAGELSQVLASVELLALPVLAAAPPPLVDAGRLSGIRYVAPFNLSGTPALSLPLAAGGSLPAGLQLAGPAGGEEQILASAAVVESIAGWRR